MASSIKTISIVGCGWFGLPLGKRLAEKGYMVKGSTTREERLDQIKQAGIQCFKIAFSPEFTGDESLFASELIIVNIPPRQSDESAYQALMLNLKKKVGDHKIPKVILISSSSVYQNLDREVTEEDASNIKTPRSGISLLQIEEMWKDDPTYQLTILRFAGLYGPNRPPGRFLSGKVTKGALNPVNMLHLEDCIGATISVLEHDLWKNTFNICSPKHPTRKLFYETACKIAKLPPPLFTDPENGGFKLINSLRFQQASGYHYKYPDPIDGLSAL